MSEIGIVGEIIVSEIMIVSEVREIMIFELPHEKTNNVVSEQV